MGPVYIGQDKSRFKWINEAAQAVQKQFTPNGHQFILIPCVDVDDMKEDKIRKGEYQIGTCITDCTDPVSFATAVAGAICSFGLTSKDKGKDGKAATKMAETILDMVKEVGKIKDDKER